MDSNLRSLGRLAALGLIAVLGGCAAEGAAGGDPGARPLPPGMTCDAIRQELRAMDSRGVPAKVEAVNAGRKVSAGDKTQAERYNSLLNYYLGGRCHVQ